jgi:hypothetical protein
VAARPSGEGSAAAGSVATGPTGMPGFTCGSGAACALGRRAGPPPD